MNNSAVVEDEVLSAISPIIMELDGSYLLPSSKNYSIFRWSILKTNNFQPTKWIKKDSLLLSQIFIFSFMLILPKLMTWINFFIISDIMCTNPEPTSTLMFPVTASFGHYCIVTIAYGKSPPVVSFRLSFFVQTSLRWVHHCPETRPIEQVMFESRRLNGSVLWNHRPWQTTTLCNYTSPLYLLSAHTIFLWLILI